jgi:glucosamine-6-phosphate deaminase
VTTFGKQPYVLPVEVFASSEALGKKLAQDILARINGKKGHFILGCPGGRSPKTTYDALGAMAASTGADFSHVVIAMMDDYVFPSGGSYVHCPEDAHYSCRRFGYEEIWKVLNAGLPESKRIPRSQVWFPDPANPQEYDKKLKEAGGIDFFILASGGSDGHVAFNPPGSALDSRTRIIPLAETTRQDNLGTFPQFRNLQEVPSFGVSVGLETIREFSAEVALVIHGSHKQKAVTELKKLGDFSESWPVSVVFRCRNARLLVDEAAAPNLK